MNFSSKYPLKNLIINFLKYSYDKTLINLTINVMPSHILIDKTTSQIWSYQTSCRSKSKLENAANKLLSFIFNHIQTPTNISSTIVEISFTRPHASYPLVSQFFHSMYTHFSWVQNGRPWFQLFKDRVDSKQDSWFYLFCLTLWGLKHGNIENFRL